MSMVHWSTDLDILSTKLHTIANSEIETVLIGSAVRAPLTIFFNKDIYYETEQTKSSDCVVIITGDSMYTVTLITNLNQDITCPIGTTRQSICARATMRNTMKA
ncbi:hypothetical protein ElyMa_003097900 [Elysia marginata]|uniref:Uncharacterized protein n=1 Tax=Elysia marginata TaxID=1093978 RepID=A0AAV4IPY5_9GAST|nr:hypothetical protein ElyMa_003097900 [Elysia marginata]